MNKIGKQYGSRNKKLVKDGYFDYQKFLKSDTWKEIRDKFHSNLRAEYWRKCHCCGTTTKRLIPHHQKYKKVTKVTLNCIVPVCRGCHQAIHDLHKEHKNWTIRTATRKIRERAMAPLYL